MTNRGLTNVDLAFDDFVSTMRQSLKIWDYFVNWDKVFRNTRAIELQLNLWNFLLGKEDLESEFHRLLEAHPEIVQALPSLIVRDGAASTKFAIIKDISDLDAEETLFDFSRPADTFELRCAAFEFVTETGLSALFRKDGVKNLVDYVLGVEAGLDSNGRKNRSGNAMELVVREYLNLATPAKGLKFLEQATPSAIKAQWGFDVPVDKASRRFDFAISDGVTLVLLEVNFYGGGGSKLKATAGEYIGLGEMLDIPGVKFAWVTDGHGWRTTLLPLRAAYEKLDHVWNLKGLSRGNLLELF